MDLGEAGERSCKYTKLGDGYSAAWNGSDRSSVNICKWRKAHRVILLFVYFGLAKFNLSQFFKWNKSMKFYDVYCVRHPAISRFPVILDL